MKSFPSSETTFLIPGPAGELEISVKNAASKNQSATVVICHPHPLHGGTMNNKVVTTLARTFEGLGIRTVRFNFRGVEKSTGTFAEGIGETDDLLAVIEWIKTIYPNDDLFLAGFSFGAYVSARAASRVQAKLLVSVAPPVSRFNLNEWPSITIPWIIIQGEEDEIVPPEDVYAWVKKFTPQPILIRMPGAGHFFHGQLLELRRLLENAIKQEL